MYTEEFIDLLLSTSRSPVVVLDEDLKITKTNRHLHENFSLLEPKCEGQSMYDVSKSIWKTPEMEHLLVNILPSEKSVDKYAVKLPKNDDSHVTVSIDARYYSDDVNKKTFIYLVLEDVTESEKTYTGVRDRDFLESIVESAYYGIAIYSPVFGDSGEITDFTVLFTNAEVPANFGFAVSDVVGKRCSEVYPGIFKNGVFAKMVKCYSTRQSETYEVEVEQENGTIWLSAAIEVVNNTVTVSSKNCTAEKEASSRLTRMNTMLSDSNKKLERLILHEFSESFASYRTGKSFFDFLLQELWEKTGITHALIGEVVPEENGEWLYCLSVCANGEIVENFNYPLKDGGCGKVIKGSKFVYDMGEQIVIPESETYKFDNVQGYIGYPLQDAAGRCIGLIAMMHTAEIADVAYVESLLKIAAKRCEMELERQRHEKLLEEKNAELQRQNSDLASFTYIASHDLQEPLRKIRMFNSRIIEKDIQNLSDNSISYLNSINATADRMQNLINALLSYSSMDSDDLRKEKTNLNTLLRDVMVMMDDLIDEKKVIIESDPLPKLYVIPMQFQQLLYNILSNAIKYAKQEGQPKISISARKEIISRQKYWRLDVADNGIGFDPQYKDRIFEVFQRLHGKKEYAGTGVGLAICTKIMQNHNGMITATGEPGVGATFSIFVPE
ncbi:MAG: PAS domain-containing protein [Flavobacterium sp.]|nr:PAS domain-containing protein [Flavobacterium sp.]